MSLRKSLTITIIALALAALPLVVFAGNNNVMVSRAGLMLNLDFGDNNASTTPVVYDSSGNQRHVVAQAPQTCSNNNCYFDGATNYLTASGSVFNSSTNLSVAIKFNPNFVVGTGIYRFFDSSSGQRVEFFTCNTAGCANYNLNLKINGAYAIGMASSTVMPYWKQGQTNVLIYSGTSGNNNAWLNGRKILSGDSNTWTPQNPPNFYVGSNYAAGQFFNGNIYYIKIWNRLLTNAEVTSLSADRHEPIQAPTRKGLVGYWTMDTNDYNSAIKTVLDKSGQGKHATSTTALSFTTGKIKQSVDTTGGQYVDAGNSSIYNFGTSDFTLSVWIKPSMSAATNIITKYNDTVGGFSLNQSTLQPIMFLKASNNYRYCGANTLSVGQWTHVTFVKKSTTNLDCYINGTLNNSTLAGSILADVGTATSDLYIGGTFGYNVSGFRGYVDEARIYNYALSAKEVKQLYNSSRKQSAQAAPKGGLVAYWTLDSNDVNGKTIWDKSGQNFTGTSSNTPSIVLGKIKQAMSFNGASDGVTTSLILTATSSISFGGWVKWSGATGSRQAIFGNGTLLSNGYNLSISNGSGGAGSLITLIPGGISWNTLLASPVMPTGQWTHVFITRGAVTWTLYVNGQSVTTGSGTPILPTGNSFIGRNDAGDFFNGVIDDMKVYNRALSASEVKQIYSAGRNYYVR